MGGSTYACARWFFASGRCRFWFSVARADGAADNAPEKVRPVPPKGIALTDADRANLSSGLDKLSQEIAELRSNLKLRPELLHLLPDVEIYEKCSPHRHSNTTSSSPSGKYRRPRACSNRAWKGPSSCKDGKAAEYRYGTDRSRLHFEDRRLGPAVWASRTCLVPSIYSASIPARCLVPRSRRNLERGQLYSRPSVIKR